MKKKNALLLRLLCSDCLSWQSLCATSPFKFTSSFSPPHMDQAQKSEPGSSQPGRQGISGHASSESAYRHHQHGALDDILNMEQVEAADHAIIRTESHKQADFDSQRFPTSGGLSKADTLSEGLLCERGFGGRVRLHGRLMRAPEHVKVTNVELFYDLVFVYASKSRSSLCVVQTRGRSLLLVAH